MSNDLNTVMGIAATGLAAQNARMKVIAQNLANANTTALSPGGEPYRRQTVLFRNEFDRALGAETVEVVGTRADSSQFGRRYEPSHPAADADGYVLTPNVRPMLETMDMREAQRSYEANLGVIEASRTMMLRTLDLLRQ